MFDHHWLCCLKVTFFYVEQEKDKYLNANQYLFLKVYMKPIFLASDIFLHVQLVSWINLKNVFYNFPDIVQWD